jgi:ubiquinone biosynthesis monooxygenase Coq7
MRSVPCVSEASEYASRVLKVNHAGENGAVNIYAGQIFFARFTAPGMVAELVEFKSHEEGHRAIFWEELQRRNRPRCRSYWLCGAGGFTLGLVTGLFGRRAIAATTVAVERVVLRHLEHQLETLRGKDEAAVKAIESIVIEERQAPRSVGLSHYSWPVLAKGSVAHSLSINGGSHMGRYARLRSNLSIELTPNGQRPVFAAHVKR